MTEAEITALAERLEADIVRTMGGETLHGMTVAGWRWKTSVPLPPNPETNWAWSYASHWSTPPAREKAERLFTEADVRALLAERDVMRGVLEPFANLGVTSGPDNEPCSIPYRITRGSIRKARQALAAYKAGKEAAR